MSREPQRVELFEEGPRKLTLTRSDRGSLNNRNGYTGRADRARIHGRAGSVATFYDDQKFRTGENYVAITKRVDEPIDVLLANNFVGPQEQDGEKVYLGENQKYSWIFYRRRKPEWWEEVISSVPGGEFVYETAKEILDNSEDPRVRAGVKVVRSSGLFEKEGDNFRVDNCSSVRFGA